MKKIKKIVSLVLAVTMALAMSITAFATEETEPEAPAPAPASGYSITINNPSNGVSMEGNTYSAYRLFNVTYNGKGAYSYTIAPGFEQFSYPDDGQTYTGQQLVKLLEGKGGANNAAFMQEFAKAAYEWVETHATIQPAGTVTATDPKKAVITFDKPGYFIVYGQATAPDGAEGQKQVVAAIGLTTTAPDVEMNLKADAPSIDKVIVDADSDNGKGTAQDVGSTVSFKLTSRVPNMTGYTSYTYNVHDTLSNGLTFNNDVKVTINGTEYKNYEVKLNGQSFDIVFDPKEFVKLNGSMNDNIEITYSATINENALTTSVETNTVNLQYSNNPKDGGTGKTTDKEVYVYDFDIVIDKYIKNNENETDISKKLADAEFVLKKGDKYYHWNEETKKVEWVDSVDAADKKTTNTDGVASFTGIEEGSYELIETKAPDGYNKLDAPVPVVITVVYNEDGTIKTDGEEPKSTVTLTNNRYGLTSSIANSSGSLLPSTGGIGTTIFYIVGAILVIGAGVILVVKKRMSNE